VRMYGILSADAAQPTPHTNQCQLKSTPSSITKHSISLHLRSKTKFL